MTNRQSWALFCATGLDCRGLAISVDEATNLISRCNDGEIELVQQTLLEMGAKGKPKKPTKDWAPIWQAAIEAGTKAAENHSPKPMRVLDTMSAQEWIVNEGVCGFAWIKTAGNTSFGRWAKKHAGFRKAYPQGIQFWVSAFGQSYERKVAFAKAAAEVLKENGIVAYAGGRLD